jgi:shikimate dehydrogenase
MKKACVIGWPIKHSRSPLIHNYWLKQLQINGIYERVAVEPKDLRSFIRNLKQNGYQGCNVTIPHKEAVLAAVDSYDKIVRETGSLNTVFLIGDKIQGTSTDGHGFLNNILSHFPNYQIQGKTIFMIGAGGSAKAICQKLLEERAETICVLNRTPERVFELQQLFGSKIHIVPPNEVTQYLKISDMLINTSSQGMIGQAPLEIEIDNMPQHALVADIVYVPLKTKLIMKAESLGLKTVPGLGMLLHQAVEGFHHWFGVRPQVSQELYGLVAHDIAVEQLK